MVAGSLKTLKNNTPSLWLLCLILFVLSVTVYANTLWNGYVMDDISVITENTIVTKGISGIPELLVTPRLKGFGEILNDNYRPLSLVMFAVEHQLFGPNPLVGHAVNILLFGGCTVLLFLFLCRLFPTKIGVAFTAALLFSLHPIHTEVVANIKSRDELMCFFGSFCALLAFLKYAREGRLLHLLIGGIVLFLAFLSKETVVCFVLLVPAIFFFFEKTARKRALLISITTIVATVLFLLIRASILKGHDSSAVPFLDNPLVGVPFFSRRLPTAIMVLGMYLRLLFVPYPLISDYSYNSIPAVGFGSPAVLISLLIYILLIVVIARRYIRKGADPLAFGIVFYLGSLALFSNIFFVAYSEMAERLVFFASAGFCIAVSTAAWELLALPGDQILPPRILALPLIVVCALFAALTCTRNAEWKDNYTIFSIDVERSPNNARLLHSLGYTVFYISPEQEPDPVMRQKMQFEAVRWLQKSLAVYPNNAKVHRDIGTFFRGLQQYDSAEVHLQKAARLLNGNTSVLSDLGFVYFASGQYRKAIGLLRQILPQSNERPRLYYNMAMGYVQLMELDSALAVLDSALLLSPADTTIATYRKQVLIEKNRRAASEKVQ